jgi:hypothetical protein
VSVAVAVVGDEDDVVEVDAVGVHSRRVVVAELVDRGRGAGAEGGAVGGVGVAGVAGEGAAGVLRLVGQLQHLFADEVVALVADAGVGGPVVGGVRGTGVAGAADAHVPVLAEAAALVEVLVEAAGRRDQGRTGLGGAVVDLVVGAPSADPVDQVVAEVADAGLLGVGVDLVGAAGDDDAGVVDARVAGTAAAGVVLREVGLVDGAALADVLDDLQPGLALAGAVDQHLVGPAGIDAVAPLGHGVVGVAGRTDAADSVDAVVTAGALAVERGRIERFVGSALVAVQVGAGGDLRGGIYDSLRRN